MTRGNHDNPPHDPLWVGQPFPGLKDGWSDPQGVDYYRPAMNPQSFGADAPPTWGLRQIGPPRGGPFPSDPPNEALPIKDLGEVRFVVASSQGSNSR